jgi:hypothetical protein
VASINPVDILPMNHRARLDDDYAWFSSDVALHVTSSSLHLGFSFAGLVVDRYEIIECWGSNKMH